MPHELERVRRENESLRRQINQQQQEITEKEKELAEKQRQIQDLERKFSAHNRNSTNSSKPPSSDGLAGQQRVRGRRQPKGRRRRKPGGHTMLLMAVALAAAWIPSWRASQVDPLITLREQ